MQKPTKESKHMKKTTRRSFIKTSALAGMGIGMASNYLTATSWSKIPGVNDTVSLNDLKSEFLNLKFGMFIHYNMATYMGAQWVDGYPDPAYFDPCAEVIDTDAWADAAVAAGMKYAVLTAKHVSGFCLWDSEYTSYDVMHPNCPYQKDLVARFVESFLNTILPGLNQQ